MRIEKYQKPKRKKKKRDNSIFEKEILAFLQACLRPALNKALEDVFRSLKI